MNTLFDPNIAAGFPLGTPEVPPDSLSPADPHAVRVLPHQQLLFPNSPRATCEQLGLTWWAANKLYEDGWLSFSPETTPSLDEAQEAELRFVGSLSMAGCDRRMMVLLLSGLTRPYAYQPSRMYYEWASRRWRVLPESNPNAESVFHDWLDTLVSHADADSLHGIVELAHDALTRIQVEHKPHR